MTDSDITIGEIGRSVKRIEDALLELRTEVRERHHTLNNQLQLSVAPISVHTIQIESQQKSVGRLDDQVRDLDKRLGDVTARAAFISGGIATLGAVLQLVPWPWKK